jgi:NAD(P)-dependent dehydrogenase (short-subunit alcohol dehydrogenase family)
MVNTIGTYLTCRIFVPAMLEAGWGRIVNISSAASLAEPEVANSAYSVSKVALNRLTRHLAAELTGTGVSAALIHPGSIKTDMWASVSDQAAALGEAGAPFRAWAQLVEQTGGDPYSSAVRLVLDLIDPGGDGRNGEFCWLEAGLETPLASW